jgi:hypothetical protein
LLTNVVFFFFVPFFKEILSDCLKYKQFFDSLVSAEMLEEREKRDRELEEVIVVTPIIFLFLNLS